MTKFAFMAAASVLAMSAPVQAAKFLITYTGTVSDGFDTSGEFGAPNTDLTGLSFVAQYTLDTSGNAVSDNVGTSRQIFGGTQRSTDSPLFGSVTINNRTSTSIGKYLGFVNYTNDFDGSTGFVFDNLSHNAYDKVNNFVNDIENTLGFGIFNPMNGLINSSDYTQDTNYTVRRSGSLPDSARGDLRIYEYNFASRSLKLARANFVVNNFTVVPLGETTGGAVPEPASWAMMIVGFGLVGGAMRQRRIVARVTYA